MNISLHAIGVILSTVGSLVSLWRAYIIIKNLENNALITNANFKVIKDFMDGKPASDFPPYTVDAYLLISTSEKKNLSLLLLSVYLTIAGIVATNIEEISKILMPMSQFYDRFFLYIAS